MECLNNIIGLSKRECDCLPEKQEEFQALNASTSGFFLDNIDWVTPLRDDIFTNCDESGIWDKLVLSRQEGLEYLLSHLIAQIDVWQVSKFGSIKDTVGQRSTHATNMNNLSKDILGLEFTPRSPRGTVLYIKGIQLLIAEVNDYEVKLIKVNQKTGLTTELETVTVAGGSNNTPKVIVDWKYEFEGDEKIYIAYDRLGGFPLNTEIHCVTCSSQSLPYEKNLLIRGYQSEALDDMFVGTSNKSTYGLFIDFVYQCDYLSWLCGVPVEFWTTTKFGKMFAKLYQLSASLHFNQHILASGISNYTLVEGGFINAKNNEITTVLNELVPQLAIDMPSDYVDCFTCRTHHNSSIRTLTT